MFFRPNVLFQLVFRRPYGIHSPFLFDLTNECFFVQNTEPAFQILEKKRKELLRNNTRIPVTDFGRGPRKSIASQNSAPRAYSRTINSIARNSLQSPGYCRLMWRLVHHFKPQNILELGTSLGLTTAYLANAAPNSQVFSLEGCPHTAEKAKELWASLGITNVQQLIGPFNDTLPMALDQMKSVDFVYIDGDHSYSGVMQSFNKILPYLHSDSILVIDDIRWSADMHRAWLEITANSKTTMSVDLYRMGISFCSKALSKQIIPVGY